MLRVSRLLSLLLILSLVLVSPVFAQDGPKTDIPVISLDGGSAPAVIPMQSTTRSSEIIIGDNNLKRINPTTGTAWRATAKIIVSAPFTMECTGFFVSSDTVVTPGSCLYQYGTAEYATELSVIPALNGTVQPYGAYGPASDFTVQVHPDWSSSENGNHNIGVIKLPDTTLGDKVGTFMQIASIDPQTLYEGLFKTVTINGYPLTKVVKNGTPGTTMWKDQGPLYEASTYRLYYQIDVEQELGAPIWGTLKGKSYVIGIHTREGVDECGGWENCGIRFDSELAAWLTANATLTAPIATDYGLGTVDTIPLASMQSSSKVAFEWTTTESRYTSFELEVYEISHFSMQTTLRAHKTTTKLKIPVGLKQGKLYIWRVRGIQANGIPGAWAEESAFLVDTKPPSTPRLLAPYNTQVLADGSAVLFVWDGGEDDYLNDETQPPDHFDLQIKLAGTAWSTADVHSPIADGEIILPNIPAGKYQWRVRAVDQAGNMGKWSRTFTVTIN